ncbi:hypothetical protein FT641_19755 [Bacillus paranthracis]|uniref:hypothetical protein n=1 Tax=Bacillus paranthracis TaxID=2026186 RepID=UPI00187A4B41|nr:hypothetical protein [Bacillus paranthracis]MBE7114703.1 hypothetical protein [Bacillus paranthracis]MBE7154930.1 hypothetical protein [Bacillus paranthracis]
MEKTMHAYKCETGCGVITMIDKYYKGKRVFCGACGSKETMVYQGECMVNTESIVKRVGFNLGINRKLNK